MAGLLDSTTAKLDRTRCDPRYSAGRQEGLGFRELLVPVLQLHSSILLVALLFLERRRGVVTNAKQTDEPSPAQTFSSSVAIDGIYAVTATMRRRRESWEDRESRETVRVIQESRQMTHSGQAIGDATPPRYARG